MGKGKRKGTPSKDTTRLAIWNVRRARATGAYNLRAGSRNISLTLLQSRKSNKITIIFLRWKSLSCSIADTVLGISGQPSWSKRL